MNSSRRTDYSKPVAHIIIWVVAGILLLPLFWLVVGSLKSNNAIFQFPPAWLPHPALWSNYIKAVQDITFFTYARNSIIIAVMNVIGALMSVPLVAYGFSRVSWSGRNIFFFIMLSTAMLPFQATMLPLYIIYRHIGWLNTFYPLIVPAFFGNAFLAFLLRQFMLTIPRELSEAATMDGAHHFQILYRIIVPLVKPGLATVAIFSFVNAWTEFQAPLVFLTSNNKFTLALGLQSYQTVHSTAWAYLMAGSTLYMLPVAIVFLIAQRQFIGGINLSGIQS